MEKLALGLGHLNWSAILLPPDKREVLKNLIQFNEKYISVSFVSKKRFMLDEMTLVNVSKFAIFLEYEKSKTYVNIDQGIY